MSLPVETSRRARRPGLLTAALLAGALGPGCMGSTWEPIRSKTMREAGSVSLAVLSVEPWQRAMMALQPNFAMDESDALQQVIKDSRRVEEEKRRAVAGAADYQQREDGVEGTDPASASVLVGVQSQGAVPGYPQAIPYEGKTQDEKSDAMMQYQAATALFQQVKLINRVVQNAAIPSGYRPYLVQLQIGLVPRRRHSPYDVFTTIAFFSAAQEGEETGGGRAATGPRAQPGPRTQPGPSAQEEGWTADWQTRSRQRSGAGSGYVFEKVASAAGDASDPWGSKSRARQEPQDQGGTRAAGDLMTGGNRPRGGRRDIPLILPLLVTDNMEATYKSKTREDLVALALQFGNFAPDIMKSFGLEGISSSATNDVYGRDINSLLTVNRNSDNTLKIRIGAVQEATANYAMVARNHTVALLLMVPEEMENEIALVARTVFVDTETGEELYGSSREDVLKLYDRVLSDHEIQLEPATVDQLRDLTIGGQWGKFQELLQVALGRPYPKAQALWIDLSELAIGSMYAGAHFELPGHGRPQPAFDEIYHMQTPILYDDNFEASEVKLSGISVPGEVRVDALVEIMESGIMIPAESVEVLPGNKLKILFRSFQRDALYQDDETGGGLQLHLSFNGDLPAVFDLHYRVAVERQ